MPEMFDLAVIGGGVNGAGIARDAAGRGARVLLLERGDLAEGTSSNSTKLIHGGLRYLEHYEFALVRESLQANPDVDAAQAALRQARELYFAQQGGLFPSLNANGSGQQQLASPASQGQVGSAAMFGVTAASLTIASSPDVFGGVRRQVDSREAAGDVGHDDRLARIDDDSYARAGREQVRDGGPAIVIVREHDGLSSRRDGEAIDVGAHCAGQHDARAVVVGKKQGPLDLAGGMALRSARRCPIWVPRVAQSLPKRALPDGYRPAGQDQSELSVQ